MLQTHVPSLNDINVKLGRLADQERESATGSDTPGVRDKKKLIGHIDPSEPALIQEMRRELRVRHKALETERAWAVDELV